VASDPTKAIEPLPRAAGGNLFITRPPVGGARSKAGLDVVLTKAAVDFQNPPASDVELLVRQNLDALREAASLDVFFIALIDEHEPTIGKVIGSASLFATFNPEILSGQSLESLPYLRERLEHIRIAEIRDTQQPRRELAAEAARFASLQVGSVLMVGFAVAGRIRGFFAMCSTRPRDSWDANLHLAMKLLASSYASGLERKQYRAQFNNLEERSELALHGANDGLWDFDLERTTSYFSPRWKSMLGYSDDEVEPLIDWQPLVHPEDLPRVQIALRDHLAGKEPMFESVHRLKHRDGFWLWVVSRAKARLDEHGRTRRIVGVDLDVTERKLCRWPRATLRNAPRKSVPATFFIT
jgi:PAS domain S-box-containing protein